MAIGEIVARLTLNAQQFRAQFDGAIDQATAKAKTGGRQIGEGLSGEANSKLNEFASRIPVVGGALAGLSGPALLAAAGIGAVSAALGFAIGEAEAYAKESSKLDAVLKATGNTTGFSAQQLRAYADELETTFAISAEEFLAAERQLSSFRGIAGSTFKDVLELAADLAATFGGDVVSNSEKLGNVLQNLAAGDVDGLAKGFKFLGVETLATVKALAESGKTFEAQQALIDALRNRVGGAGAAGGDNLTGDFFRLKDAIGDSARALAESSGAYDGAREFVKRLANEVAFLGGALDDIANRPAPFTAAALQNDLVRFGLRPAPAAPAPAPLSIAAGAAQFAGLPGADRLSGAADLAAGRAAANAAKAEGDKRRAAEAAAKELVKQEAAQKAVARAAEQQAAAVSKSLADLRFQAETAGLSRDEAQKAAFFRNLELQAGKALTPELRLQADLYFTIARNAEATRDALAGLGKGFQAGVDASISRTLTPLAPLSPENGRKALDEAARQIRDATKLFNKDVPLLSRVFDDLKITFKDFGDDLKASLKDVAGSFADRAVNQTLGRAFDLAFKPIGAALDFVFEPLEKTSGVGALAGAAAGFALGGPVGALIGLFAGGALESIAGKDPYSDAFLTTQNGQVGASRISARGDGREDEALGLVDSVAQGLAQLAGALGGSVANGLNLGAIGSNKGTFYFNPTGGDFKAAGRQSFATPEEAITAALRNAISQGAITGVDESVKRLLSTGDLQIQVGKAAALANALRVFDEVANPFAKEVRSLTDEFTQLRDIMIEAGSSTADLNKASAGYERGLQAIKDAAAAATSTLRDFLSSLGFGSASPLSLGDQRSAALANYQAATGRIGESGFDQGAFVAAGQRLLDIEGQLFGRTDSFFSTFRQVQADTSRAIAAIDNAASITGDNPFARATADNTAATAENTAMLNMLPQLPAMIGQQIAAALAQAGIGGGGGGRGFVIDDVKAA
jgi:hypothetical protein